MIMRYGEQQEMDAMSEPFEDHHEPRIVRPNTPATFYPRKFMLAGNAVFTLRSEKTGNRFTYRVRQPQDMDPKKPIWFVSVLTGSDNDSDYAYLGYIIGTSYLHGHSKSRIGAEAPSAKAASWTFHRLLHGAPITGVEFFHEGRCGRCGRRLTVPESIESGFGPECIHLV